MNVADSLRVASALEHLGYRPTQRAEEASVIVLNTCVVRQSAEDKAYGDDDLGEEFNKRYDEAVAMVVQLEYASTSYLQRRLRIGYNTAARIIEKMEAEGIVGPAQGSRPREVLVKREGGVREE